jgi:hypothetical protein
MYPSAVHHQACLSLVEADDAMRVPGFGYGECSRSLETASDGMSLP